MFSFKFSVIFKNTFFTAHLRATVSVKNSGEHLRATVSVKNSGFQLDYGYGYMVQSINNQSFQYYKNQSTDFSAKFYVSLQ